LTADATDRERKLWVFVVALVLAGFFLSRYTVQAVHGPLGRLVTAAERFGAGDLRRDHREILGMFRVLADAIQHMGDRLRQIVGEVIGDRTGSPGGRGPVGGERAAAAVLSRGVDGPWWRSRAVRTSNAPPQLHGLRLDVLRTATGDMADAAERAAHWERRFGRWPIGTGATSPRGTCYSTAGGGAAPRAIQPARRAEARRSTTSWSSSSDLVAANLLA